MSAVDAPSGRPVSADWRDTQIEAFFREIPVEGSLGLLALGAVGVIAWRKKRDAGRPAENAVHG